MNSMAGLAPQDEQQIGVSLPDPLGQTKENNWWLQADILKDYRGVCCLADLSIYSGFAAKPPWEETKWTDEAASSTIKMVNDFSFRAVDAGHCKCTCCAFRQFVSSIYTVVDIAHDKVVEDVDVVFENVVTRGDKYNLYHLDNYEEWDYAVVGTILQARRRIAPTVFLPSITDEWRPRAFRLQTRWGPRNFIEDVSFYWPGHPQANKEGVDKDEVPAHLVFFDPPSPPNEKMLADRLSAYGRPSRRPSRADPCNPKYEDEPVKEIKRGTRVEFEIIFYWVVGGEKGCLYGGLGLGHGPLFWHRIHAVYQWDNDRPAPQMVSTDEPDLNRSSGWDPWLFALDAFRGRYGPRGKAPTR